MKRYLSLLLICIFIITAVFTNNVSAESKILKTFKDDSQSQIVTIEKGNRAQLWFKVTAPFSEVSIEFAKRCNGKNVAVANIYKWDSNSVATRQTEPIASTRLNAWEASDCITVMKDGGFEAGEYFLDVYAQEGKFYVTKYIGSVFGAKYCYNDTYTPGSIKGYVKFSDEAGKFTTTSNMTGFSYVPAPEQTGIQPDSNIAIMGVDPTKFAAIDDLGRTVEGYSDVGEGKDKVVGMFYWTWHDTAHKSNKPINITQLMEDYPELKKDYHNPLWKEYTGMNFWNEPLFGFYARTDKYVLRKHAEMLANAGVDFVLFDCTNGDYVWKEGYMALLETWAEAREQGVKTPQVSFMLQFGFSENTVSSIKQLYDDLYSKNLYKDLWFYWEGKPLIMGHGSGLSDNDPLEYQLKNYFTFRGGVASYFGGDGDDTQWGWLHVYPQAAYKNSDGTVEMTTVGVAQNANYQTMSLSAMNSGYNMGRSFTMQPDYSYTYSYRGEKITVDSTIKDSMLYGLNIQEQWDYAISLDPEIIFVTGWNEWVMGRYEEWCGVQNGFPDQYDDENSRDIEPSKGALKDHYYYQLVSNIRRFKGASKPDSQLKPKTIDISKGAEQWQDNNIISYNYYTNNTYARNAEGYLGYKYVSEGTRNDIRTAKVSYDKTNLYFYVETVQDLSPYTDPDWMRLLLDTKKATEKSKDWEEFEYILNRENPSADYMTLERSTGDWNWQEVGKVSYTVSKNVLQVKIPRKMLGLEKEVTFNFKWCDNNLRDGDIMELYTEGSAAPGGRFVFQFTNKEIPDYNDKTYGFVEYAFIIASSISIITMGIAVFIIAKRKILHR